jgi:hypothetical protein
MTRTDIRDLFQRNRDAADVVRALGLLLEYGLAHRREEKTATRTAERWFAGRADG